MRSAAGSHRCSSRRGTARPARQWSVNAEQCKALMPRHTFSTCSFLRRCSERPSPPLHASPRPLTGRGPGRRGCRPGQSPRWLALPLLASSSNEHAARPKRRIAHAHGSCAAAPSESVPHAGCVSARRPPARRARLCSCSTRGERTRRRRFASIAILLARIVGPQGKSHHPTAAPSRTADTATAAAQHGSRLPAALRPPWLLPTGHLHY